MAEPVTYQCGDPFTPVNRDGLIWPPKTDKAADEHTPEEWRELMATPPAENSVINLVNPVIVGD